MKHGVNGRTRTGTLYANGRRKSPGIMLLIGSEAGEWI